LRVLSFDIILEILQEELAEKPLVW